MNRRAAPAKNLGHSFGHSLSAKVPVLFLVFVFLVGGGARSDLASLPLLRSLAILFAFWAATGLEADDWRRIRTPLTLLLLLTVWIAIQLVPMPPEMWHALPGRDPIIVADRLLNQPDIWRPITLTPSQTWNSLLAMSVPIAGLLVAARVPVEDYPGILWAIVGVALLSSLLGFAQLLEGNQGSAYLYRITNAGSMVGLFANRNHHAIFIACAIILAAVLLRDERMRNRKNRPMQMALIFAIALFTAMSAMIGSRGGFIAGVCAFVIAYVMIASTWGAKMVGRRPQLTSVSSGFARILLYSPPILLVILLGTAIWLSERTTAISRIADRSLADDMRVHAWPTVQAMIENYWVTGSGFGSFPDVFKMFEPDHLLQPSYFNHAHNDWAELLLVGGVPMLVITLSGIIWFSRRFATLGMRNLIKGHRGDLRLGVLFVVVVLAGTSLVDYPLRVPSLQMMAIMLITLLCCPTPPNVSRD